MNDSYMKNFTATDNLNAEASNRVRVYLNKVYTWMSLALLCTALVASYTITSEATLTWISTGYNSIMVLLGSVAIFLVMLFAQNRLTPMALGTLFLAYSALSGLVFGPILMQYTQQSVGLAFGCTAGTFGAMSIYGACTKRNLSGIGRVMTMMLIGLIICSVVNIFVGSSMLDFGISIAGVGIFSVLTAYDTQKLIEQGRVLEPGETGRPAVMGALTLYLDFINLFLFLLRLLGRRD